MTANFLFPLVLCGLGLTAPQLKAAPLDRIVSLQQAQIKALEARIPDTWFASTVDVDNPSSSASSTWKALPGTRLEINLKPNRKLRVRVSGSIQVRERGALCSFALKKDDSIQGDANFGQQIVMGEYGLHWQTVTFSQLFVNLQPGKHTIEVVSRVQDGGPTACQFRLGQPFGAFTVEAIAYDADTP